MLAGLLMVSMVVAIPAVGRAQDQDQGYEQQVRLTLSCSSDFLIGVDVTVGDQSMQIPSGQARVFNVGLNSVVHVSGFAIRSCDFNIGSGGSWEIYAPAPFVTAGRYLGN